ncbi:MAG: Mrp/NBP35 family ATP-binding protein [Desulfobacter postgatei]|jgi:Mrp family chromosome partitioning ATPase|uniref:Mrp/NBP35 family ATP-binding protein n=1 Tax=Desulfobacter postgatei TaxID=2293 RepID=UPI0023EFF848|nr:Mrp/NBP35 family ATP-binding protein [Desulfobacter postgatei]MDD4272321.1 Mrp/NBP35 family ATP-binding protein [Desulfobacter postgatei]MDX9963403.1 Mrp/NBP35 family ATP-binding protein [Desulfobacter postgatei]
MIHKNVDQAKKASSCSSKTPQNDADKQRMEMDAMIKDNLARIKHKIFVLSGKGGVGKSSVSANLAATLAKKGYKTGLMDVDVHGPSIAQMFNITELLDIAPDTKQLLPKRINENLTVVSVQALMQDKDQAVIWRGPAKTGIIKQFIGSVAWGNLDFLVIDAPPGTGDEPLTVVQTIPDARGIIVTTPQEVALADVRKSISFCKTVKMETLGIIENMAGYTCPHCNKHIDLFKSGGGEKTAKAQGLNFLGSIPFDTRVVESGDDGVPVMMYEAPGPFKDAFEKVVENILKQIEV